MGPPKPEGLLTSWLNQEDTLSERAREIEKKKKRKKERERVFQTNYLQEKTFP